MPAHLVDMERGAAVTRRRVHSWAGRRGQRGFTLLELAIVLFILTLLLAGVMTPLTRQLQERQIAETRRGLADIQASLLGHALSHRDPQGHPYLPCPDRRTGPGANDGLEDRLPEGGCAVLSGNLPWLTLGLPGADAWGNRYTYAVSPAYAHAQAGIRPHPAPATALTACLDRDCSRHLAAAAVWLSHGPNGLGALNAGGGLNRAPPGADEAQNADGDGRFVSRPPAGSDRPGGEFDDLVQWLPPAQLLGRLCLEAGC